MAKQLENQNIKKKLQKKDIQHITSQYQQRITLKQSFEPDKYIVFNI